MIRFLYVAQCSLLVVALSVNQCGAQDLGGLGGAGTGGGAIDGDALSNQIFDAVDAGGGPANTTNQTTGNTNTTGGNTGGNPNPTAPMPGVVENSTFDLEVPVPVDQRNRRGFVGASFDNPDEVVLPEGFKFVGAASAETATTRGGAGGGGRGGVGGGTNVSDGIFVNRNTPIRTRMVPNFRSPQLSPVSVSNRFNRRVNALPSTSSLGRSMNVVMQGRTAVIQGTAQNRDQIMRIANQLRFEPGVSRIVSQVTITQ